MDIRCQQFTSYEIANEMLDFMGYQHNLFGKTILESSCGVGNILCLAVERYIRDAQEQGYTSKQIAFGLARDICGAEIVEATYRTCIDNLNEVAHKYNIENVQWNIFLGDILKCPFKNKFDYIIGNPPYISYRNLEIEVRIFIKEMYQSCREGKPDYCYAFIENAIQYLAPGGSMVYLIPNSIFKNVYAQQLRNLILQYIEEIWDYPNRKLFADAMTSSAIMLLRKGKYVPKVRYRNISGKQETEVSKSKLTGKWIFANENTQQYNVCFRDCYRASMAVATQKNGVFVIDVDRKREYGIEEEVLRPAVSPRNQKYENKEEIIFPYNVQNNQILNYSEEDFRRKYPNAYAYLKANKEELDKRDADKAAQWFEYGRSQAIQNMSQPKLLVSTVVTNKLNVYEVTSEAVPYAGIYIIANQEYRLKDAKRILESKDFLQYIRGVGTPASGSSLRITANDINNYGFVKEDFF